MYATVRNYSGPERFAEELVNRQDEVKGLIQGISGFQAYATTAGVVSDPWDPAEAEQALACIARGPRTRSRWVGCASQLDVRSWPRHDRGWPAITWLGDDGRVVARREGLGRAAPAARGAGEDR